MVVERIKSRTGITDPDMIALISRVTVRYGELQTRALAGENVEQELAIVEATAMSLDSATRRVIGEELQQSAVTIIAGVLTKLLGG